MDETLNEFSEWEPCLYGVCDQCHEESHALMDRQQFGWMCAECRVELAEQLDNLDEE